MVISDSRLGSFKECIGPDVIETTLDNGRVIDPDDITRGITPDPVVTVPKLELRAEPELVVREGRHNVSGRIKESAEVRGPNVA